MKNLYSCLIALVACVFTGGVFADDSHMVKLEHASSFYYSGGGFAGRAVTIEVKVRNVAPSKTVTLVYSTGGSWSELPLSFHSTHGNYDVFRYNSNSSSLSGSVEFAIRYQVDGNTYWDNNDGLNFFLAASDTTIIEDNVVLAQMTAGLSYSCPGYYGCSYITPLSGEIFVENLSYDKSVGVRCSSNGTDWHNIAASYEYTRSGSNVEVWRFSGNHYAYTPYGTPPSHRCAVYYNDHWDNNFGQDYFISQNQVLN